MDQWTAVSAALVPVDAALQVVCATVIDEGGGRKGVSVKRRDRGGALFLPHVQGDAFPHGLVPGVSLPPVIGFPAPAGLQVCEGTLFTDSQ